MNVVAHSFSGIVAVRIKYCGRHIEIDNKVLKSTRHFEHLAGIVSIVEAGIISI